MKKIFFSVLLAFACSLSYSQSADSLKIKLSKEWTIKGYEQFGVLDPPTAEKKNDKIHFKAGNACVIVEKGKSYTGTWTIDKTKTYIQCTLSGGVKRNYKIISVKNKEAVIEYQSPDLVRTKYHMEAN